MKVWMLMAIGMIVGITCCADDTPPPEPVRRVAPKVDYAARAKLIQEKTVELHKLQDEILKLGGTISSPRKVRITLRIVAIDAEKLKQQKIADPLDFNLKLKDPSGGIVTFESDKQLLQTLEPLVTSGCAEIVFSPTVIASMGETTVVNCFRELPCSEESLAANKQSDLLSGTGKVPGMGVHLRASDDPDSDMLRVAIVYRFTEDDPWKVVTVDGRIQPGTNSRRLQSTINLKSGAPLGLSGPMVSNVPTKWTIRQVCNTSVPPNLDAGETPFREVRFYPVITAERLLDDRSESVAQ